MRCQHSKVARQAFLKMAHGQKNVEKHYFTTTTYFASTGYWNNEIYANKLNSVAINPVQHLKHVA